MEPGSDEAYRDKLDKAIEKALAFGATVKPNATVEAMKSAAGGPLADNKFLNAIQRNTISLTTLALWPIYQTIVRRVRFRADTAQVSASTTAADTAPPQGGGRHRPPDRRVRRRDVAPRRVATHVSA
jgi:hypothetical protein